MNRRLTSTILSIGCVLTLSCLVSRAQEAAMPAQWLWVNQETLPDQTVCFRYEFTVADLPRSAQLFALLDHCRGTLFLNGQRLQELGDYEPATNIDVLERLRLGENQFVIVCRPSTGPSAIALRLAMATADRTVAQVVTDDRWQATVTPHALALPLPQDLAWQAALGRGDVAVGLLGTVTRGIEIDHLDDYTQWKDALGTTQGTNPATFDVPPGFEVSLIRSAQEAEDSWVSLAQDPQGRWIIAREKQGLLRLTSSVEPGGAPRVEVINENLAECRGLLFAYDSLYAMANNDKALYRLRDTNGDDQFDEVQLLQSFAGDVGHGRNQLTLGPDGLIYAIFGDAVFEPEDARSLVPSLGSPSNEESTRSGYVARCDEEGKNWEVLVRGLRNPFGIDFNADGEMFTYDADAEYDMGSSWYRPTRVNHLLIGGDYGWRRVTGQWPPYFPDRPDTPQPTLDIGKGSPTAVEFGQGERFPLPYRDALFVLDWAYGRILAVHLEPRGASYLGTAENFLRGRPLNVTDLEFGRDGAMYFVTGGRGTQSALYRVDYVGPVTQPRSLTEQQQRRRTSAAEHRQLLAQLRTGMSDPPALDLDFAWSHLAHPDPWIRHAARTAIEFQPVEAWRQRALEEPSLDIALAALTALARAGTLSDRAAIATRLSELDLSSLTAAEELEVLFLAERCLQSTADSQPDWRPRLLAQLASLYPSDNALSNDWLSRIFSEFDAPANFVETTLPLLRQAKTQEAQLHYLFVLRDIPSGWTQAARDEYFSRLAQAQSFVSGEGMPTFLRLIQEAALQSLAPEERPRYEQQLASSAESDLPSGPPPAPRPFVRAWSVADFDGVSRALEAGRDLRRGEELFRTARCDACHRFGPRGGVLGPDLSAVGSRFSARDILVSIIEPSRVIAAKYQSETFELQDGQALTGRVVAGDYRSEKLQVMPDLLIPEKRVEFLKAEVEHRAASPVSPMPTGLLDTLERDEILDLIAFLTSSQPNSRIPSGQ